MQVEPDQRSRGGIVLGVGQLVDVNSKNRDLVMMRLFARRRARPPYPSAPKSVRL
jgi:hypothetical protein